MKSPVSAWYAGAVNATTEAGTTNGHRVKNHAQLLHLVARAERGALLPGEAELLRDALNLLDDMATTLDKLMGRHDGDYETDTTGSMRVVQVKSTGSGYEGIYFPEG